MFNYRKKGDNFKYCMSDIHIMICSKLLYSHNLDPMEDDSGVKECEERLRRIQTAAAEDAAPVPEIVRNNKNHNVPFVVKSKLSVDLIGADSRIPQAL
jgi:hypothetical protein